LQKDLTEMKIFLQVLGGGWYFFETPCRFRRYFLDMFMFQCHCIVY